MQKLIDYDLKLGCLLIECDITSAISLTKNPVLHSQTKHIHIRHHFLRNHVKKGDVIFEYVNTKSQLANIYTKPLSSNLFHNIFLCLGVLDFLCFK